MKLAARVQVVFMVAKLAALAVIIIGGIVKLAQGKQCHDKICLGRYIQTAAYSFILFI